MKKQINWTEIIIIVLTAIFGFFTWYLNENSKIAHENYVRREQRYSILVSCIHGFSVDTDDKDMRDKFIKELDQCWLYCSDEVILKAYSFLDTVARGSIATENDQKKGLGELILSIRKDLIKNENLENTNLLPSNYRFLKAF